MSKQIVNILFSAVALILFVGMFCVLNARTGEDVSFYDSVDTLVLLVSQNIRPYVEATSGIRKVFPPKDDLDVQIYELESYKTQKARLSLTNQLDSRDMKTVFISVGPEAAKFLWQEIGPRPVRKFYTIVLNPEKISPPLGLDCGIALNIPPEIQLNTIHQSMPEACRIGIFYDPEHNSTFFQKARQAASNLGIILEPLEISAKSEITSTFEGMIQHLDAIWLIPDRTVISESIAQYLIRQGVLYGVPVIGYNQFFYESGAAAAFVFDYESLGRQTGLMVAASVRQGHCKPELPEFSFRINKKVFDKLGISMTEPEQLPEVEP